jgi:hypothetical protein
MEQNQVKDASSIMKELYAQFPQESERTIVKSGVSLVYLPISEVINRLNKVLGVEGWSFEIITVRRDEIDQDELVAHVALTAEIGDKRVVKHGFGGSNVKRAKSNQKPVDLGNDFKGAVSDALKKAAQQLGVGLYLARSVDAMDAEDAILLDASDDGFARIPEQVPTPALSELEEKWNTFIDITKGLKKEQKEELNSFWSTHSGGRPKPTKSSATIDDLQALITEALRIQFGGQYVTNS